MTEFTERFKTYSNTELLKIIDNPDDYQPLAVEAANAILSSRQLTDEDFANARAELGTQRQEKKVQDKKKKDFENKVKDIGTSVLSAVNPIPAETPNPDRIIKIISIVLGVLFLFQLYKEFGMIIFMFTDSEAQRETGMALYFLPLIIIPIAIILFFRRNKLGWTLLMIFLTYSAVSSVGMFILTLNTQPSGIPVLDKIFPQTSPEIHILAFLFFSGILWRICKVEIREIYSIDKKYMLTAISVVAAITVLINYGAFV